MKIQQFDGGLSTRTEPQFLNTNQGTVYENIDNASGILKPLKMPAPAGIFVKPYHTFFDHNQEWVDSDEPRDYVEYQRKLYWTDRTTAPQKYDGTTQANLGIEPPAQITGIETKYRRDPDRLETTIAVTADTAAPKALDTFYVVMVSTSSDLIGDPETGLSPAMLMKVAQDGSVSVESNGNYPTDVRAPTVVEDTSSTYRTVTFADAGYASADARYQVWVFRYYQGKFYSIKNSNYTPAVNTLVDDVEDISSYWTLDEFVGSAGVWTPSALEGTLQYQYTYYNSTDGTESGPSLFSEEVTRDNFFRSEVPVVASVDTQVDKIRLYRVGGNVTTSSLVAEVPNTTDTVKDNIRDTDLTGQLLISSIALNPPIGLAFLTKAYAMLFGAEGSKLRFTPIGEPDSWPELYFLEFDLDITGIAAVSNGVLVFTKYETHLVTGTGPNALSKQRLSADQGCLAFESIQVMGGAALWISTDGICTSGGGPVQVVSKQTLGKFSVNATASAIFDESYYVLDSGGTVTQFDFAYGKIYKTQTPGVTSLAIANDVLYGVKEGELQEFYAGAEATMKYKSPRFIEGSVTEQKWYKKFTIYHEGDIIIKVYIDNALVATRTLTGIDSTEIQVPSKEQRGHFVQFELEGTGTVHEIEYVVGRS